ncbi:MAG: serine hydrolase domain-containing protein [Maribacter sp.]
MKTFKLITYFFSILIFLGCSKDESQPELEIVTGELPDDIYFPPLQGDTWEAVSFEQLEWNESKAEELFTYLEEKDTKGFMILYNGRIVAEKYYNGHNSTTSWPWYSAAKSLTATFVGIAQEEGLLNINNKTSDYLGMNWTSLETEKENLITVKHHLSMATGLTDYLNQPIKWICNRPTCLEYTADAGARWAYHQGAFMLLQEMVTSVSGISFEDYCKVKIADKIGMSGQWTNQLGLNVYNTNTRGMARFGLLSQNMGKWDASTIVSEEYFNEMINSSQDLNKAYGYCWWLNGKDSFLNIDSQTTSNGSMIPNAPDDMFSALGSQDQKIYVVPSRGLVIVRQGDRAGTSELGASSFDNELWGKINEVLN